MPRSSSSGEAAGHPRAGTSGISAVGKTSSGPGSEHPHRFDGGLNSAGRRMARWTSLDSDDRRVFNVWVRGFAVFYASLAVALLVLLGGYAPVGQNDLSASAAMKPRSSELSAQAMRSIGK